MIYHYSKHENNIIACALEYWAYPTNVKQLVEALEQWAWAMDLGGKETDPIDKAEGKATRLLIKKLKKKFKVHTKKRKNVDRATDAYAVWHALKGHCDNHYGRKNKLHCKLTNRECKYRFCKPISAILKGRCKNETTSQD